MGKCRYPHPAAREIESGWLVRLPAVTLAASPPGPTQTISSQVPLICSLPRLAAGLVFMQSKDCDISC